MGAAVPPPPGPPLPAVGAPTPPPVGAQTPPAPPLAAGTHVLAREAQLRTASNAACTQYTVCGPTLPPGGAGRSSCCSRARVTVEPPATPCMSTLPPGAAAAAASRSHCRAGSAASACISAGAVHPSARDACRGDQTGSSADSDMVSAAGSDA
eukprot:360480-Chlamydomonas_euryale.AAC.1